MDSKLEQTLIEKYKYLFAEKARSEDKLAKQDKLTNDLFIAQTNKDDVAIARIKEEMHGVGPYYPIAFGFECDNGWYSLLDELMEKIVAVDVDKRVEIHQVKEKLGGLRFYINDGGFRIDIIGTSSTRLDSDERYFDQINELISIAEGKSYITCEICGKPAKLCVARNWLKTVCLDHREVTTWSGSKQKYIPVREYKAEDRVITPLNLLSTVVSFEFRESEDSWFYTLDDGDIRKQEDLKQIPMSDFYPGWFVKDKTTDTEYLIVSKEYDPSSGWNYTLSFDDPVIVNPDTKVVLPENRLEIVRDQEGRVKTKE